jgi:hypothetical protein
LLVPKSDLSAVDATLDAKLSGIKQAVEKKPTRIILQILFLLFPETNAEHFYKKYLVEFCLG